MERLHSREPHALSNEKPSLARAPYMDSYPTYLSANEREIRPTLWKSHSASTTGSKTPSNGAISKRSISGPIQSSPLPLTEARPETPRAPVLPTRPVFIPSAPRTEPNLPSFVDPRRPRAATAIPAAPKTEPNLPSFVNPRNVDRPQYISPGPAQRLQSTTMTKPAVTPAASTIGSFDIPPSLDWANSVHTMPRSTPATSNVNINCYAAPPANPTCCCCCTRHKRPSRLASWKSVLKGFFFRNAEDESDLEHIETSHWTDT